MPQNTSRINLPEAQWVLLAEGPLTDCIIVAPYDFVYVYAASTPVWDFGYPVAAKEIVNVAPVDGQGVYGYCADKTTFVYVTEG